MENELYDAVKAKFDEAIAERVNKDTRDFIVTEEFSEARVQAWIDGNPDPMVDLAWSQAKHYCTMLIAMEFLGSLAGGLSCCPCIDVVVKTDSLEGPHQERGMELVQMSDGHYEVEETWFKHVHE